MTNAFSPDSREAIMDAAEALITRNGHAGFSMRQLAQESGFAKGTLYHYFRDKQAIILSILERDLLTVQKCMAEAARSDHQDFAHRLQDMIQTYFALVWERRHMLLMTLHEVSGSEIQLQELARKHRRGYLQPVAEIIRQGIQDQVFRPVPVEMAAMALLGMMNQLVNNYVFVENRGVSSELIEHTVELFLHGIASGANGDPEATIGDNSPLTGDNSGESGKTSRAW